MLDDSAILGSTSIAVGVIYLPGDCPFSVDLSGRTIMERNVVGGVAMTTHRKDQCSGDHCVVHNPSQNHMSDWPLHWRGDAGMFERICPHGIGHWDFDSVAHADRIGGYVNPHSCDGCCQPPFPSNWFSVS